MQDALSIRNVYGVLSKQESLTITEIISRLRSSLADQQIPVGASTVRRHLETLVQKGHASLAQAQPRELIRRGIVRYEHQTSNAGASYILTQEGVDNAWMYSNTRGDEFESGETVFA